MTGTVLQGKVAVGQLVEISASKARLALRRLPASRRGDGSVHCGADAVQQVRSGKASRWRDRTACRSLSQSLAIDVLRRRRRR